MSVSDFDHGTHWVSKQIAGTFLDRINNPVFIGFLKFGLIWDLLSLAYLVYAGSDASLLFLVSSGLGLFWMNIAPVLIWYYDERVLPRFFRDVSELIPPEQRNSLSKKYGKYFSSHSTLLSVLFSTICVGVIYVNRGYLQSQGMVGAGEVFIWTSYAYAAYFGGVLAAQGFTGPVAMILIVRDLCQMELQIDPLHPDNLGGLGVIGKVAISTTILYSTGSLFLPLLFRFVSATSNPAIVVIALVIYLGGLIASFLYPTLKVNREAQEVRNEELERLRTMYRQIQSEMADASASDTSELNKRLELQRIRQEFDKLNSVRLYPMEINILTRLGGSVILPLILLFLEFYLSNM